MTCNCKTRSFLHLSTCSSVMQYIKIPLEHLQRESFENPGSIIFYVAVTDDESLNQLKVFRSSLSEEDWLYQVAAGSVGTMTLKNTTEVTFLPEAEAFILLELPNSAAIYYELTPHNRDLAEQLLPKTGKLIFIDPSTKEVISGN